MFSLILDLDDLKAPQVDKTTLLSKDVNRKLTHNNPLPSRINPTSPKHVGPNKNNKHANPPPVQIRNRKVFKTVKEENRLDLHQTKNHSLDNRKNSFINKVEILYSEKGENISKLKILNQPFCGSFIINSSVYDYYNSSSSKNIKNKSSFELTMPSEQLVMKVKQANTFKKSRFTSDSKLPHILPHK